MQFSKLALLSFAMLCSRVAAEYKVPDGFDKNAADPNAFVSWCIAQQNSCPLICGGNTNKNECDSEKLTFTCECEDGKTPDVSKYKNTLPHFVCEETFAQCIENNASDSDSQQTCKDNRNCGTKSPKDAESQDEATSSATGMATSTKDSATATGTETAQATQTGAAIANNPSTGIFAGAMVAGLGLFM